MRRALVVVDMQEGFMNAETEHLRYEIKDFIEKKGGFFDKVIATRYVNGENTPCYRFEGWKGCMPGSRDLEMVDFPYDILFSKGVYSCYTERFRRCFESDMFDEIYFCGVNTGCCVLHSAFDTYNDLIGTYVIGDLCGSTSGNSSHEAALQILRECITKERVISKDDARFSSAGEYIYGGPKVRAITTKDLASVQVLDRESEFQVYDMLDGYNDDELAAYAYGIFDDGELIGYCTVGGADFYALFQNSHCSQNDVCLSDVFITERYRGTGCGARLLGAVTSILDTARELLNEDYTIFLTVLDDRLCRFYEQFGFTTLNEKAGVMHRVKHFSRK